ncbi:MAG: V-type ATP synthase subunit I, partial [Clostridiales bacterium]|nr:V-type ATP synthase subunit I [Clostridiales bacterium]
HWDGQPIHIERLHISGDSSYVMVAAVKSLGDAFLADLRSRGFISASIEKGLGTPEMLIKAIEQQVETLKRENEDTYKKEAAYADQLYPLQVFFDALSVEQERVDTAGRFVHTQTVFYAKGWVPEALGEKVKQEIQTISPSAQMAISPPLAQENPPVLLHNNSAVTPFESVVSGFSLPDYRGLDPTAVMMPFFLNFFGMMVSDAGYGLLMAVLIPLMIKFFKPAKGMRNMMKLLAMGGGATLIWGFLYNTWFGFSPLPVLFDAINNPIPVMAVCIGTGAIHLFAGLGVAAYMNIKRGKPMDAVYDQLSWFMVVVGAGLLLLPSAATVGKYMALAGIVIILITAGREKGNNPIKRLISGFGALYGVTSWVSDLLSYMRLFGMGLATGVIGMVINQLVGMVFDAGFIGVILGSLLFCGGHLFNAGINVLGAYVHSCRLQYIEFFGKFYEDGGVAFTPLRENTRYVTITDAQKAA